MEGGAHADAFYAIRHKAKNTPEAKKHYLQGQPFTGKKPHLQTIA